MCQARSTGCPTGLDAGALGPVALLHEFYFQTMVLSSSGPSRRNSTSLAMQQAEGRSDGACVLGAGGYLGAPDLSPVRSGLYCGERSSKSGLGQR